MDCIRNAEAIMQQPDPYGFLITQIAQARFEGAPRAFKYAGREFIVYDGVFSPLQFRSTQIFTRNLRFAPGRSFLEIGCGAGVTAIVAALAGCRPVVATDINPTAVHNARANAWMHGVEEIVAVRQGDLFDVVNEGEFFETIYCNLPFVYVATDYKYPDDFHKAVFDAGYACHARYLKEAPLHLAPGGTLLLGFGSLGDERILKRLAAEYGYGITTVASETSDAEGNPRYDLLELTKNTAGAPH